MPDQLAVVLVGTATAQCRLLQHIIMMCAGYPGLSVQSRSDAMMHSCMATYGTAYHDSMCAVNFHMQAAGGDADYNLCTQSCLHQLQAQVISLVGWPKLVKPFSFFFLHLLQLAVPTHLTHSTNPS